MTLTLIYISKLFITLISSYYLLILIFIYYIYQSFLSLNKKIYNNKFTYYSLIKDKEYLLFKDYLFYLYYSSIIILTIFLIKFNYLYLLLELNIYSISLFSTFLIIYSI